MVSTPDPGSKGICIGAKETQGDSNYKSDFSQKAGRPCNLDLEALSTVHTAMVLAFTQ